MTLFVDASALVAIIQEEAESPDLLDRLHVDDHRLTSAIAVWETARVLQKDRGSGAQVTLTDLTRLLDAIGIAIVPINADEALQALITFERYGKGRHAARLNMGDCFAYACATTNDARLLYKGDDFVHTDMA